MSHAPFVSNISVCVMKDKLNSFKDNVLAGKDQSDGCSDEYLTHTHTLTHQWQANVYALSLSQLYVSR